MSWNPTVSASVTIEGDCSTQCLPRRDEQVDVVFGSGMDSFEMVFSRASLHRFVAAATEALAKPEPDADDAEPHATAL